MYHEWRTTSQIGDRMDASFYAPEHLVVEQAIICSGASYHRLGAVLDRVFKGAFYVLANEYRSEGIPFIRVADITGGEVDLSEVAYLSPETHRREKKTAVSPGTLVIAKGGSLGNCAVVPARIPEANISQDLIGAVPTASVDAHYLQAFLTSRHGRSQMFRWAQGNVHPHITNEGLRGILATFPSPAIQRAIGHKVRKAERSRELARLSRAQVCSRVSVLYGRLPHVESSISATWVRPSELGTSRLDGWFHQPLYLRMARDLESRNDVIRVGQLAQRVNETFRLNEWRSNTFEYFEINGVDSETGRATPAVVAVQEAPSRAKTLVRENDVLVSTVRPNLRAIAQIGPIDSGAGVASSGFCALRAATPSFGAYLRACLVTPWGTHQLMRWNSGGTYPAIDHDVPLEVQVPNPGQKIMEQLGEELLLAAERTSDGSRLIAEAKLAVEQLIEGDLDVAALLAEGEAIERWLTENSSPSSRKAN